MNRSIEHLDQPTLDHISRRAKYQLLEEVEGKYAQEPAIVPLISFIGLLIVEFAAVGCLVFERDQNLPKALGFASVPIVLTVAAAAYQAEQYGVPKEREKLCQDYQSIPSETSSSNHS